MKVISFCFVSLLLLFNLSLNAQHANMNDSIKYAKIIQALNNWDIKSSITELQNISKSSKLEDEAYFYFFKGNITLYSWLQVDSTQKNNPLSLIDSTIKYYERAMSLKTTMQFSNLYIKSPQQGLDSCANIIGQRAKMNFLEENYLTAMNLYEKILDFSNNPIYIVGAGLTALKLTSYYKAVSCFQKALTYNPTYEKAWLGLSETYKQLKDSVNGLKTAKEAMLIDSLNKNYLINYYNISVYFKNSNEIKNAVAKMERYASRDINICSIIANHYIQMKEFQKAESYVLLIALKQKKDEASATKLKFYYNWYLNLTVNNNLTYSKANSIGFVKKWIENRNYILSKTEMLLMLITEDLQLSSIIEFLNLELK